MLTAHSFGIWRWNLRKARVLDRLLQDFAYRISIGWWIFAVTGAIVLLLTLLTAGWRAIKAAATNPVDAIMRF